MANESDCPTWDQSDPEGSLQKAYDWTVNMANHRLDWYKRSSGRKKYGSQLIRAVSIILVALGLLFPLVDAAIASQTALAQLGYVCIAGAAAFVGYDHYFGYSSGWMRLIVTQLAMQREMKEFQHDWLILQNQRHRTQNPPDDITLLLERLKEFTVRVEALVEQETETWVAEFQSSLSELQKLVKTELDARKMGKILVVVPNAKDFDSVDVQLDKISKAILRDGEAETLLTNIPPGSRAVTLVGNKANDPPKHGNKIVEVKPDEIERVEIPL